MAPLNRYKAVFSFVGTVHIALAFTLPSLLLRGDLAITAVPSGTVGASLQFVPGVTEMLNMYVENRQFSRRYCALSIEVRIGGRFPIKGVTSDISPGGCYVSLASTLTRGTVLELRLPVDDRNVSLLGTVITADYNLGNGIQFTGVSEQMRLLLERYLEEIGAAEANSVTIMR